MTPASFPFSVSTPKSNVPRSPGLPPCAPSAILSAPNPPSPHALGGHPLHRSCRVLRSLPAQERSARIALLRRRKAPRRALGQICATHLEMERRFAKEAPGPLRKIFQESRLISLAPASAVFSSHRGTGSGGRSLLQNGAHFSRCAGTLASARKARGPADARTSAGLETRNASRQQALQEGHVGIAGSAARHPLRRRTGNRSVGLQLL